MLDLNKTSDRPSAVGIGKFDGLHLGHRRLIGRLLKDPELVPIAVVLTVPGQERILSVREEDEILRELGVQKTVRLPLTRELTETSAEEFVNDLLVRTLNMKKIVCGPDFRFGKDRKGDTELLKSLGSGRFETEIVRKKTEDGDVISSSRIRALLRDGAYEEAVKLLGQPLRFTGTVVHGRHLGAGLGFPTANIRPEEGRLLPRFGVYKTRVLVGDREYDAITDIGVKPTVDKDAEPVLETHIPGFSGDLYGSAITVTPVRFIREERRFKDVDALKAQIARDLASLG